MLSHSILTHASEPVAITPLVLDALPIKRRGLTPFTYSRFLVPYLCGYEGFALFLDADIILNDDIVKLFGCVLNNGDKAVWVSKNDIPYEWASVMLFNCERCRILTPNFVDDANNNTMHDLSCFEGGMVGDLPAEWNHLVGYDAPRDDARLVHYTQGVPAFPETATCEYADLWHKHHRDFYHALSWQVLMGNSKHACEVNGVRMPLYYMNLEEKQLKPEYEQQAIAMLHLYK